MNFSLKCSPMLHAEQFVKEHIAPFWYDLEAVSHFLNGREFVALFERRKRTELHKPSALIGIRDFVFCYCSDVHKSLYFCLSFLFLFYFVLSFLFLSHFLFSRSMDSIESKIRDSNWKCRFRSEDFAELHIYMQFWIYIRLSTVGPQIHCATSI